MALMADEKNIQRYAIFATGGKQYQAIEGKTLAIEKIESLPGATLEFSEVLFFKKDEDQFEIGTPHLKRKIAATVLKQIKDPKIVVYRFQRRKKVQTKRGHRQPKTVIRVVSIA